MATLFYDPFVDWQKLTDALDAFEIDGEERAEVIEHAEHIIHIEVLIVFVQLLPVEKHQEFLEKFHAAPHDPQHLQFLQEHASKNVEQSVRQKTDELIAEILSDLSED